jgi:hypothetical protein
LFKRLLTLFNLPVRSYAEIRHHWGKALKILGDNDEAVLKFEEVMSGDFPLNSTRLQLVRLYAKSRDPKVSEKAGAIAEDILSQARNPLAVSSSTVLGVVEDLSWAKGAWLNALFERHGDLIEA